MNTRFKLILPVLLLLIVSCGTSVNNSFRAADVVRQPVGAPQRFEAPAGVVFDEFSCKSPLTDPQTGVVLRLVRSGSGFGDYDLPMGEYGVAGNELLRIKCSTGEVVGVVKK